LCSYYILYVEKNQSQSQPRTGVRGLCARSKTRIVVVPDHLRPGSARNWIWFAHSFRQSGHNNLPTKSLFTAMLGGVTITMCIWSGPMLIFLRRAPFPFWNASNQRPLQTP
jgi:hypothetical protein